MTPKTDDRDDDKAWLDALAGRSAAVMEGRASRQVELLQRALDARKSRLEAEVPVADEELFGRIEEEVLDSRRSGQSDAIGMGRFRIEDPSDAVSRSHPRPWIWGLAAVTFVAFVTLQQWSQNGDNEHLILRGPADVVQFVDDPDARLVELTALLRAAGATPEVQRDKGGTVRLTVTASDAVLDALATQRLQPQPQDGKVVLILQKTAADNKP
jgi:hypothetical protein